MPSPVSMSRSLISFRRTILPFSRYWLSPPRKTRRPMVMRPSSARGKEGSVRSVSVHSAMPSGLRLSVPLKMTSSMVPPRSDLALCSPSTQVIASERLLLPQPLGPTMAVMPPASSTVTGSTNDLKPEISSDSTLSIDLDPKVKAPEKPVPAVAAHRRSARSVRSQTAIPGGLPTRRLPDLVGAGQRGKAPSGRRRDALLARGIEQMKGVGLHRHRQLGPHRRRAVRIDLGDQQKVAHPAVDDDLMAERLDELDARRDRLQRRVAAVPGRLAHVLGTDAENHLAAVLAAGGGGGGRRPTQPAARGGG